MLNKFLSKIDFDSYEQFKAEYAVNIPERFNFAYDIVDGWAKQDKDKPALVWCDDNDEERIFSHPFNNTE